MLQEPEVTSDFKNCENKNETGAESPFEHKVTLEFAVEGKNFRAAGEASSRLKHTLQHIGFPAPLVRRVAVAAYEAEMNIIIHANRGTLKAEITPKTVTIWAEDEGPGIPDIELAMQEGYSTAPDYIREMGFGAGMGLPNIKKCSDILEIETVIGAGTRLKMVIFNKTGPEREK